MSGLIGSLAAAARALDAQRYGLDVAGQNIANVNTKGYTRRVAELAAIPPRDRLGAGGGVDIAGLRASRDALLELRLQRERPAEQREAAIAGALAVVEVAIGRPGESLDARLSAFFDSAARLADDPVSSTARQELILQGEAVASAFRDMATRLDAAQRDADAGVQAAVGEVNALAVRVATLNDAIVDAGGTGAQALHLRDQQRVALDRLAELLDVESIGREDGGVDLVAGSGRPLVIGATAYELVAAPAGPAGLVDIEAHDGTSITVELTGGRIGGLLQVRDALVPAYQASLDELAYRLAVEVNAIHTAGFDLNGAAGGDFFVPPAAVAGAAAALTADTALAADPSRIVAASVAQPGDNEAARALMALRDARVMNGGQATLIDAWGQLVYRVGRDTQAAQQEQASRAEIVRQVEALVDAVSGVSLDEEAMMMLRFQRAYEANARFFRAVDESINTLIQMLGR